MILANTQAEKVALVTGSARRIGAAIVKKAHEQQYKVMIHCNHSRTEADALAQELNQIRPNSALVFQGDLTQKDVPRAMIAALTAWVNRLDILVHNASIFKRTDLSEDADDLFAIHVHAPFALSLAARPLLTKSQGAIINITDIHAQNPLKGYALYCQSKAALNMQTLALAKELAPDIRVNAVAPGPTLWPEGENDLSSEDQKRVTDKTLRKRLGDVDSVAKAVLALAENEYITGQILSIDGGRSIA